MKSVLLIALCIAAVFALRSEREYKSAFEAFKAKHEKLYGSQAEESTRYNIFKANVDYIDDFNNNGSNKTFQVAINKFADLTNEEFRAIYLGVKMPEKRRLNNVYHAQGSAVPDSWNWATKGAVTPIKDQGQCGSCWSFSTTGSVEGCTFIATGKLVSLSEQDLVDCSTAQGDQGCDGGLMDDAFQYIIQNKGIDTESCYPYTAEDGTCHYSKSCCGATITGYTDVTSGDEKALLEAVYKTPVSIAIDASQSSFQFYSGGVYSDSGCSSQQLDHGVLAVGYGSTGGSDYWIVKNSWGSSWGLSGYIWMARNDNNMCGVATMPSYPTGCNTCN
jgi:cathepsin L